MSDCLWILAGKEDILHCCGVVEGILCLEVGSNQHFYKLETHCCLHFSCSPFVLSYLWYAQQKEEMLTARNIA